MVVSAPRFGGRRQRGVSGSTKSQRTCGHAGRRAQLALVRVDRVAEPVDVESRRERELDRHERLARAPPRRDEAEHPLDLRLLQRDGARVIGDRGVGRIADEQRDDLDREQRATPIGTSPTTTLPAPSKRPP